jgi:uncharacterized protein (DUF1697 family)
MPRYAAFLRGINISKRRVTSEELRASLEELGFTDVAAFRASGNLIFSAEGRERADKLAARIEAGLGRSLGYEVPVFLRTAAEVKAIAGHDPFPAEVVEASDGKLQVSLLSAKPTAQARKKVLALATDQDKLAIRQRELFWLPSGGTLKSELDLKAIAAELGSTTMRTKGTIDQIAAKFFAD